MLMFTTCYDSSEPYEPRQEDLAGLGGNETIASSASMRFHHLTSTALSKCLNRMVLMTSSMPSLVVKGSDSFWKISSTLPVRQRKQTPTPTPTPTTSISKPRGKAAAHTRRDDT